MEDEDEELELSMMMAAGICASVALMVAEEEEEEAVVAAAAAAAYDTRVRQRGPRVKFDHEEALQNLQRDYLGPYPKFDGLDFDQMFRISRGRFEEILNAFVRSGKAFYKCGSDCYGNPYARVEAKILLPLKTFAFGVACHAFRDYFQMSRTLAKMCCYEFCSTMIELYQEEFLRLPTEEDLKSINRLHLKKHGANGFFGSLDCMHVYWKNCPMAWQGQYKGKEKKPSIVLEAISDHNMWFWHTSFGYAGTLNDLNILSLSPFIQSLTNGSFSKLEKNSGVVPFEIEGEMFDKLYILVDGIYPQYSRFVKGNKRPVLAMETAFTQWQESARKDIERAFGCLQSKFQVIARPMHALQLKKLGNIVHTCLIIHNMCVSDRIMCEVTRYKPDASVDYEDDFPIEALLDVTIDDDSESTINHQPFEAAREAYKVREAWAELADASSHKKLLEALQRMVAKKRGIVVENTNVNF
jgi:Plant transposon protein